MDRIERQLRHELEQFHDSEPGVGAGLVARAELRAAAVGRRRALARGAAGVAATALVLAGALTLGQFGPLERATPASRSVAPPDQSANAYVIPDAVAPKPGQGMTVAGQEAGPDLGLATPAMRCAWSDQSRRPVAVRQWEVQSSAPGVRSLTVTVAGFVEGSGRAAYADFVLQALPCTWAGQPQQLTGAGPKAFTPVVLTDLATLAISHRSATAPAEPMATTIGSVGDLMVTVAALGTDNSAAIDLSRTLADEVAGRLTRDNAFPPSRGGHLGRSDVSPNQASDAPPADHAGAYTIPGSLLPREASLPTGFSYDRVGNNPPTRIGGLGQPAVLDAQTCDVFAVREARESRGLAPATVKQVAGLTDTAVRGDGVGADPSVALSITGWERGRGADALQALRSDTSSCVWIPGLVAQEWPGHQASDSLLMRGVGDAAGTFAAVRLVGDLTLAVVAQDEETATRLSDLMATTAAQSDLPAAKGR